MGALIWVLTGNMVSPGSELLRDPPIGQINLWVRSQHHHPVPQLSAEMGDSGGWTSCFMVEEEVEVELVFGCAWRRPRPKAATIVATPMSSAELSERFR